MPLSSYTELQASIADWLDRDDLETQIRDFITLAEAELNRTLFIPEREEVATASVTGSSLALPTDFWGARSFILDADPQVRLEQLPIGAIRARYDYTGRPAFYALQAREILFGPSPDAAYSVVLNYWQTIPPLSTTEPTNWLLEAYPDLYLYSALLKGSAFAIDQQAIPTWQAMLGMAYAQAQQAGQDKAWGGSPIRLRAPSYV
jgi:hypothetical protein